MKNLGYCSTSSWNKGHGQCVKQRCEKLGIVINKRNYTKHTDEEVVNAASNSSSVTETMVNLGLKPNGYAHARFKQRLKNLGFEWKNAAAWSRGKKLGPKRHILEYLTKDGPIIASSKLRKRLIREGIKQEKCECCGITEWNGQKAPLQLDHKNGDHNDNRLENLQILCANCHALTPTHSKIKK